MNRSRAILLDMTNDAQRVPRAQVRREMAISLAVVVVAILTVFTLGFWIELLEKLDPFSAGAILIIGAAVLIWFRGRRGVGWAIARGTLIAFGIALTVVAVFFGVCLATQCVG
jgi:hypothetical protein